MDSSGQGCGSEAATTPAITTQEGMKASQIAALIQRDFCAWHKLLVSQSRTKGQNPQEVAMLTFDAIQHHLLPL